MDKEGARSNNGKEKSGGGGDGLGLGLGLGPGPSLLLRGNSDTIRPTTTTTSSDFVLQWGNRKRLRCMKIQVKDESSAPVQRTTVRVDRRVVKDPPNPNPNHNHSNLIPNNNNNSTNRYPNLRQRSSSPQLPPPRILR